MLGVVDDRKCKYQMLLQDAAGNRVRLTTALVNMT
jgi:hypothetical protein